MSVDYTYIGLVLSDMGKHQQALDYLNKALKIDEGLNDRDPVFNSKTGVARDYSNIGLVPSEMGNHQQALEYYNKALEIHEGLNDRVNMGKNYNNIGTVLSEMGNHQQGLEYYNKALEIDESQMTGLIWQMTTPISVMSYSFKWVITNKHQTIKTRRWKSMKV